MFQAWMLSRDTHGHEDDENAIRQIRAFLERHGSSRFQDIHDEQAHIHDRAGFKRKDDDGETEYLILGKVFRSEMCQGYDSRAISRLLADRGYLIPGDGNNLAKRETLPGLGRPRVYVVTRKILDAS